MSEPVVIRVEGLAKKYRIGARQTQHDTLRDALTAWAKAPFRRRPRTAGNGADEDTIWALKDVSFEVKQGEVVGIIGRNGAGKSTLLKVLSRITEPTEGSVRLRGRVASLLEVGTGFHPELTGRENITLNGAILGMSKREIARKFDEIVAFSEIEKFLDTPVKRYSSGMYVRLAFAVAAHLDPEILLVDEVLAVGDVEFQKKCLGKMGEIGQAGHTVLLVSHQMSAIIALATHCLLLDGGRVTRHGQPRTVVEAYLSTSRASSAETVWEDPRAAPGDERIKLHRVRVMSENGQVSTDLDVHKGVVLEISYWVLNEGVTPGVGIILRGPANERVLASVCLPWENCLPGSPLGTTFPVGLYKTECRFPADFFNTLTYSFDVHIGPSTRTLSVAVGEGNSFSFTMHDLQGRDRSGIKWQGVVHPKLEWTTMPLGPLSREATNDDTGA